MDHSDLSLEMQERLKTTDTPEDILKLINEEGYDLSDEELSMISGGGWGNDVVDWVEGKVKDGLKCTACGGYNVLRFPMPGMSGVTQCTCTDCGHKWTVIAGVLHA